MSASQSPSAAEALSAFQRAPPCFECSRCQHPLGYGNRAILNDGSQICRLCWALDGIVHMMRFYPFSEQVYRITRRVLCHLYSYLRVARGLPPLELVPNDDNFAAEVVNP